ncbi:hypothetical protein GM418_09430 [Maribellus comscasis]|uniref:Rieske domain-containing protein n=1 Tax=Maribellus comscasis TaxID=2681766 RepID=A0A6I6JRL6_9BACT|nr:hypothetical protein [Maribellus comscasis]QGY43869.1 hypothetical protein GM418_09430 [Maribellus comscasis]
MKQLFRKRAKYLVVVVVMVLFSISCDKEDDGIIPNVLVPFTINLNIYNDLTVPGNSVFFANVGFGGVIVYCELPGTYYAFDATCSYEVSSTCRLRNEGVLGTCECCDSQFILIGGGYPSDGPASRPLRSYQVSYLDNTTLRVY